MNASPESFGTIRLPAPVGRRMRLGPFPSARDALKFAGYAGVGAILTTAVGAFAWVPLLGCGFLFAIHKPDGRALDDRCWDFLRWRFRSGPLRGGGPRTSAAETRGAFARLADGRYVAGLEAGGIPVAFLPPEEARRLFERYREMLHGLERGCVVRAIVRPLPSGPYLPPAVAPRREEVERARGGYAEMVRLVCRRRHRRAVHLLLWSAGPGSAESAHLDDQMREVADQLEGMGIPNRRLRARDLVAAIARSGWTAREVG
ncbi:MAG: hypothetical protein ACREDK_07130 [Thermoplasmata archaeon]